MILNGGVKSAVFIRYKTNMQNNLLKKNLNLFWDNALNLFCMSVLTGLFAGVLVTFYNILMSIGEHTAEEY